MASSLGMNGKAYYGTAGTTASTELTNITDVTLNLETGAADVTTRGNNGWRATVATLKDGTAEFEMIYDPDDAGFIAIQAAWAASTPIALLFLNASGGSGLDADFVITNFSRSEPLEEAMKVSVTAKPTYSTRAPVWGAVGS